MALAVMAERVATAVEKPWIDPIRAARFARQRITGVFAMIVSFFWRWIARGRSRAVRLTTWLSNSFCRRRFAAPSMAGLFEWQSALAERPRGNRGGARLPHSTNTTMALRKIGVGQNEFEEPSC